LSNLVMVCKVQCKVHHRQMHFSEWVVRIRDGLPEFIPPRWVDPLQTPRRKALPYLAGHREPVMAGVR
jgi:5-methylcytosine-specific restriction protein A